MRPVIPSLIPLIAVTAAECFDAVPAFPVPRWCNGENDLAPAFLGLKSTLDQLAADKKYDAASFSVQVTSPISSLWSYHQTARQRNETRLGTEKVDGDSLYRIASITKIFTVLGLLYQHQDGKLDLDTPITKYLADLTGPDSGELPFKEITLRALASQLSGIPRDFAQGDMQNVIPDPTLLGLPPLTSRETPPCDEYDGYISACNASDLFKWLKNAKPTFAPNQQSTYSNINYELIGLALEQATNTTYEAYMQEAIFGPLKMDLTSISKPPDTHAVLPLGQNYWDVDEGVQNPTGGIYSSTNDMSKFLRYIMTHYNALATGVNWLMPASWSPNIYSFYGMPWEILRSDKVLKNSRRPVTFATKSGGLPGYVSRISILPEYNLGVTILVGCQDSCGELLGSLQETVTIELARAAEELVWTDVNAVYTGTYKAEDSALNSTIELASSPSTGLILNRLISNSTDVLATVVPEYFVNPSRKWRVQLMPTLLYKDEKKRQGEIWRMTPTYEREEDKGVWDDLCFGDIDGPLYAGLPLNEAVFWHEDEVMELPAWRVKLEKSKDAMVEENVLRTQEL